MNAGLKECQKLRKYHEAAKCYSNHVYDTIDATLSEMESRCMIRLTR